MKPYASSESTFSKWMYTNKMAGRSPCEVWPTPPKTSTSGSSRELCQRQIRPNVFFQGSWWDQHHEEGTIHCPVYKTTEAWTRLHNDEVLIHNSRGTFEIRCSKGWSNMQTSLTGPCWQFTLWRCICASTEKIIQFQYIWFKTFQSTPVPRFVFPYTWNTTELNQCFISDRTCIDFILNSLSTCKSQNVQSA